MHKADIRDPSLIRTTPSGKRIHWLVSSEIGAPSFEMRYVEIAPGARPSATTRHPHEHVWHGLAWRWRTIFLLMA